MSAPNIVNVATITAKTDTLLLTGTSAVQLLENPASSGKVMKYIMELIKKNQSWFRTDDILEPWVGGYGLEKLNIETEKETENVST